MVALRVVSGRIIAQNPYYADPGPGGRLAAMVIRALNNPTPDDYYTL